MAAFVPSVSVRASINNASISRNISSIGRQSSVHTATSTARRVVRMVAAQPKIDKTKATTKKAAKPTGTESSTKLSLNALALLSFLRGHKSMFRPGDGFSAMGSALCLKHDTGRTFIPIDQIKTNESILVGSSVAEYFATNSQQLIDIAVNTISSNYSQIKEDEIILDVLNYNFDAILRTISFGVACQSSNFINHNNVSMMRDLHEDISIPSTHIATALNTVRDSVVSVIDSDDEDLIQGTADCFDAFRDALC